jgi:hypothetical protein
MGDVKLPRTGDWPGFRPTTLDIRADNARSAMGQCRLVCTLANLGSTVTIKPWAPKDTLGVIDSARLQIRRGEGRWWFLSVDGRTGDRKLADLGPVAMHS